MSSKPFDKNVKKSCLCCVHGKKSEYADEVFCNKRGVTSVNDCCRKFRYDPLKRMPQRQSISADYIPDDFLL